MARAPPEEAPAEQDVAAAEPVAPHAAAGLWAAAARRAVGAAAVGAQEPDGVLQPVAAAAPGEAQRLAEALQAALDAAAEQPPERAVAADPAAGHEAAVSGARQDRLRRLARRDPGP